MSLHHERRRVATACGTLAPAREIREDHCICPGTPPVKLVGGAGSNPIHCLECNREVLPARLLLGKQLMEAIERWRSIAGGIFDLWYWCSEYETWAERELRDMESPVNRLGLRIRQEIDKHRRCYYDAFQDEVFWDPATPVPCPACGGTMSMHNEGLMPQAVCDPCGVLLCWIDEEQG